MFSPVSKFEITLSDSFLVMIWKACRSSPSELMFYRFTNLLFPRTANYLIQIQGAVSIPYYNKTMKKPQKSSFSSVLFSLEMQLKSEQFIWVSFDLLQQWAILAAGFGEFQSINTKFTWLHCKIWGLGSLFCLFVKSLKFCPSLYSFMFIKIHSASGMRWVNSFRGVSSRQKRICCSFAFEDMQFGTQQLCNFVPDSYRTLLRMDKHQRRDDPAVSCTIHQCTFYMGKCAHPFLKHLCLP